MQILEAIERLLFPEPTSAYRIPIKSGEIIVFGNAGNVLRQTRERTVPLPSPISAKRGIPGSNCKSLTSIA